MPSTEQAFDPAAARQFFEWLAANLPRIFDDEFLPAELGHRLRAVHTDIQWEAGPDEGDSTFFAFSPAGSLKLLAVTRELAAVAPPIPGWKILPAKPRKRWNSRCIDLVQADGSRRRFEMDDWRYSLTSFKNGEFFDVNLLPCGSSATEEELDQVGYMLVESELGEEMLIEFVDRVNLIKASDPTQVGNRIEDLQAHLMSLIARQPRQ